MYFIIMMFHLCCAQCVLEADPTCWDSPPAAPTAEGAVADPLRTIDPLPASSFFTDFLVRDLLLSPAEQSK